MKHIGQLITICEIAAMCDCGGKAEEAVTVLVDSQGYLVIDGHCSLCAANIKASFALTELQTLIPTAVRDG